MILLHNVVKFSKIVYDDSDMAIKKAVDNNANTQIIKSFDMFRRNEPLVKIPDSTSVYKRENLKEDLIEHQNNMSILEKQRMLIKRNNEILDDIKNQTDEVKMKAHSIILDAQRQAEEILEEARDKSLRIVSESSGKLKLAEDKAILVGEAKGFVKGMEKGMEQKTEELNNRLDKLDEAINKVMEKKEEVIKGFEKGMVDLIIKIASKIIDDELTTQPYVIIKMLKKAIEENKNEEWIKITVDNRIKSITAKADFSIVEELKSLGNHISVEVLDDVSQDVCVVETPRSYIDLSYNLQLKNMENTLKRG